MKPGPADQAASPKSASASLLVGGGEATDRCRELHARRARVESGPALRRQCQSVVHLAASGGEKRRERRGTLGGFAGKGGGRQGACRSGRGAGGLSAAWRLCSPPANGSSSGRTLTRRRWRAWSRRCCGDDPDTGECSGLAGDRPHRHAQGVRRPRADRAGDVETRSSCLSEFPQTASCRPALALADTPRA